MSTLPFSAAVSFMGSGISSALPVPDTLVITEEEFAHDTATMIFWTGDVNSDSLISGMPVAISLMRPGVKRVFYGYVNHAARVNTNLSTVQSLTGRNGTEVYVVGASYFMKQKATKVWKNVTAPQVVQQIAKMFGLSASVTAHYMVWDSLSMVGESYWEFCVYLAKRIGYTFYCNGAQLVFKPRQTNPHNLSGLAAIYDWKYDPGSMVKFFPQVGATSPAGGQLATRQLSGVNPRTLQPIYVQVSGSPAPTVMGSAADPPLFNAVEHSVAHSQQEANALAEGAAANNQLYISAEAVAVGNPLVSQGSLIVVKNVNGSQDGLWFVKKAVHKMNSMDNYAVDLSLGRDSMGASVSISTLPQVQNPPAAYLRGGNWVSS